MVFLICNFNAYVNVFTSSTDIHSEFDSMLVASCFRSLLFPSLPEALIRIIRLSMTGLLFSPCECKAAETKIWWRWWWLRRRTRWKEYKMQKVFCIENSNNTIAMIAYAKWVANGDGDGDGGVSLDTQNGCDILQMPVNSAVWNESQLMAVEENRFQFGKAIWLEYNFNAMLYIAQFAKLYDSDSVAMVAAVAKATSRLWNDIAKCPLTLHLILCLCISRGARTTWLENWMCNRTRT